MNYRPSPGRGWRGGRDMGELGGKGKGGGVGGFVCGLGFGWSLGRDLQKARVCHPSPDMSA